MAKSSVIPKMVRNDAPGYPAGYVAGPNELQRLGSLGALNGIGWAKIATYYHDFRELSLPLTDAEFDSTFNRTTSVFNAGDEIPSNRKTNAAVGSGVNEAFVALGAGIIAIGTGEAFTQQGVVVTPPSEAGDLPAIPAVATSDFGDFGGPVADIAGAVAAGATSPRHAALAWGWPTWRLIEQYFISTRLQINVNRRFRLVDESLLDVGMVPDAPEFQGASSSRIAPQPFIRQVNDVLTEKFPTARFLAPNSVTGLVGASSCVPPALAPVTYGHPKIRGLSNRLFCFNTPILFLPGMRWDVQLANVQDLDNCGPVRTVTTFNCQTPDALFDAAPIIGGGSCGVVCTVPGGCISIGVVFKGFALWPQACVEYLTDLVMPKSVMGNMYQQVLQANGQYLAELTRHKSISSEQGNRLGKWLEDAAKTE